MNYPKIPNLKHEIEQLELYSQLKHEYGARAIEPILKRAHRELRAAVAQLQRLPLDRALAQQEPNGLKQIQKLRPSGPRRIWQKFEPRAYADRLEGALIGRMAGCTLGAPVEFWDIEKMEDLARENKTDFPPTDYWTRVPEPFKLRYGLSPREAYTRGKMDGVPTDDDIVYTLLGLLIVERYGPDFSVENVGKAWLDYLPHACTAEREALANLKAGVPAMKAGEKNNPYCEWIGADIRADPWGYLAPAWPEKAAAMAWRDAYISHRRNGIYGEMYFAAAIAAAFAVADPVEALIIGLSEIPIDCAFSRGVRWALEVAPEIRDYRQARDAVEKHFVGMHRVHAINNACLTIFGITIGGTDFSRVIGETVAMGMDNDCTAATAGSIVGAVVGKAGIPERWRCRFNNTVHAYLIKKPTFRIDDLLKRFARQARRVSASG
jgi:ADP-ribosylglycohydrolase